MKLATGIIPARYDSKRFPGKHLAVILGKSIIQRVYEQAQTANLLQRIIIATDDERILQASQAFGAEVLMTSPLHNSGTERAAEIAEKINTPIIINIQGDEPLLRGKMIDDLVIALQDETIPMATLAAKVKDLSLINEKNIVKAVLDKNGFALYFSRSPLPFQASDYFWQHIGIYGYQRDFLLEFSQLSASRLETTEKLEQLRVLENGYKIKIIETSSPTLSVNTPQDIIRIENFLKQRTND
ncbi:MAG: 3-deoxy-manno-octulosonate cytidylyltransferase [Candidatus Aminicenantes bacterium]|nr:3-deoxy-manno-octulosonate cytidylyltransferase [Candidatus Aminicenantes bacterium]